MAEAEEEMICDLAETYHIYDYHKWNPAYIATLVIGLGVNSRVKKKLSSTKHSVETYLLAAIADRLSILVWFRTKDGQSGKNRPKSFWEMLNEQSPESKNKPVAFSTKEALDAALKEFEKVG